MLMINNLGILEEMAFTNQTLTWGAVYRFNHCRYGKIIARLEAEDQEWYFLELASELETPKGYIQPGQRFPIRKSLVYSLEVS